MSNIIKSGPKLSRRRVLKGMGVGLALPWLEAMGPLSTWAEGLNKGNSESLLPNRMAFLYVPNGKKMEDWTPQTEGNGFLFLSFSNLFF